RAGAYPFAPLQPCGGQFAALLAAAVRAEVCPQEILVESRPASPPPHLYACRPWPDSGRTDILMKPSIREKLENLSERLVELDRLLASEGATANMDNYRKLTREHADVGPVAALYAQWVRAEQDLASAQEMSEDPEMKAFAAEEIDNARASMARLEAELQIALLPRDPNDERNLFLEIRAGTGGVESAIFAGNLFRM